MIGAISESHFLQWIKTYQSAATSTVTSSAIDTAPGTGQAYDKVLVIAYIGTPAADNIMKLQQSDDDGATDAYSDLSDSGVVSGTSNELVYAEVIKPSKRYLKAVVTRGTSSTVDSIVAILGDPRITPVDNDTAGTSTGEISVSPAEGTA